MVQEQLTQETLTRLLKAAEQAHGVYESSLGHRDDNWPGWYASFILNQLQRTSDQPAVSSIDSVATMETNKTVVRRFFDEVYNQGREEVIDELVTDDYRDYGHPTPGEGAEGAKQDLRGLRSAFSDISFTITALLADADRVAVYWTGSMRNTGPFFGNPTTGKHITYSGISLYRLRDGKISETRNVQDLASIQQQLGVPLTSN